MIHEWPIELIKMFVIGEYELYMITFKVLMLSYIELSVSCLKVVRPITSLFKVQNVIRCIYKNLL